LLDWLRVEYAIEKPSNKLLVVAELDSDTWVGEVKRMRGKKQPLTAEVRPTARMKIVVGSPAPLNARILTLPPGVSPSPRQRSAGRGLGRGADMCHTHWTSARLPVTLRRLFDDYGKLSF
jgi:hypothetical protein